MQIYLITAEECGETLDKSEESVSGGRVKSTAGNSRRNNIAHSVGDRGGKLAGKFRCFSFSFSLQCQSVWTGVGDS